jgi:hypothetical protein
MVKRAVRYIIIAQLCVFYFLPLLYSQEEKIFSREALINDTRQLVQTLEDTHPDPYIRGGGKIAFHRRFQEILLAIPEQGMTKQEFYHLLLPLVASIGDGHTRVFLSPSNQPSEPGLPLHFGIIEKNLYVSSVYDKNYVPLLGALLVSVEGIPYKELLERQGKLRGCDNEYHKLAYLSGSLRDKDGLESLLPEWQDGNELRAVLKLASGEEKEYAFTLPEKLPDNPITPPSKIKLPSVEKIDFVYDFLDNEKQIALLRVDGMFSYRENFEFFSAMGVDWAKQYAERAYQKFHGKKPPENLQEITAGLPAATDTFRSLVVDMKKAKTKTLLIDIRKNGGGNSAMSQILIYFLYGRNAMESIDSGYTIKKYSDLYFSHFKEDSLEKINEDRKIQLTRNDYDFKGEIEYNEEETEGAEKRKQDEMEYLKKMPTFMEEFQSGKYEGYYLPQHVVVLCSPYTYSSGYLMMKNHYLLGAKIVGTPSAQAGNSFGDILNFTLNDTKLYVTVSYKLFVAFPNDAEKGRVLKPHYIISYDTLASYGFDPNAEILYALDLLPKIK